MQLKFSVLVQASSNSEDPQKLLWEFYSKLTLLLKSKEDTYTQGLLKTQEVPICPSLDVINRLHFSFLPFCFQEVPPSSAALITILSQEGDKFQAKIILGDGTKKKVDDLQLFIKSYALVSALWEHSRKKARIPLDLLKASIFSKEEEFRRQIEALMNMADKYCQHLADCITNFKGQAFCPDTTIQDRAAELEKNIQDNQLALFLAEPLRRLSYRVEAIENLFTALRQQQQQAEQRSIQKGFARIIANKMNQSTTTTYQSDYCKLPPLSPPQKSVLVGSPSSSGRVLRPGKSPIFAASPSKAKQEKPESPVLPYLRVPHSRSS